ncbi:hypothetical protein RGQ15_11605 [Paracoccus sp. MBLB3053]|uniref:Uncharacterized protein n=1 Tax=Paracoccus aurantius TaxID=3073814 RepID=A0ABU2HTZ2_9RHOB|nr:hypothetical protein [Paracoccus sp. MBLB3053]MDS9468212.1 hypothetical protein [Paracoccus sp. MBLB3053]
MITPRLLLIELDAASKRIERQDELVLTAAWASAALQRARKLPKLAELLRRGSDRKQDLRMYLDGARARLPTITMDQWRSKFE